MKKEEREQLLKQKLTDMSVYEKQLYADGISTVGGVDEVGRGPLAGPVLAACVVLPADWDIPGLDDSKKLSEKKRNEMFRVISDRALAIGIGMADNRTIDEINILNSTRQAMRQAVAEAQSMLGENIGHILVDAVTIDGIENPQTAIIKGDARSISIAAASIIAKVTRDNMMKEYALEYPHYAFESNKGYGTKAHYQGIREHGITPIHRRTFLKGIL
jgi:ribonuclease HII